MEVIAMVQKGKETKNPEVSQLTSDMKRGLEAFEAFMAHVDKKDVEAAVKRMEDFVAGKITWAQVQELPKKFLADLAEFAYVQFKNNRFAEAEKIFRGLSVIDHQQSYYHTALGAIYQKQSKHADSLVDYTVAINLNESDIVALVNRGEVYWTIGMATHALEDLNKAINLDAENKNPWGNRARFLRKQILDAIAKDPDLIKVEEP
ncbi:MAG: hypothetical protein HYU97_10625 [Deltaproteobacteria bacterium]|nr:hypothetical protein [Deltaproteobacteria bacterium]